MEGLLVNGDLVPAADDDEDDDVDAVPDVAAAVSLETTLVRARFSDFKRSFSAFSLWSCYILFCKPPINLCIYSIKKIQYSEPH